MSHSSAMARRAAKTNVLGRAHPAHRRRPGRRLASGRTRPRPARRGRRRRCDRSCPTGSCSADASLKWSLPDRTSRRSSSSTGRRPRCCARPGGTTGGHHAFLATAARAAAKRGRDVYVLSALALGDGPWKLAMLRRPDGAGASNCPRACDRRSPVLGELLERQDLVLVGLLGEAEDALADDVLLDLVGAAVDGRARARTAHPR